MEKYLFLLFMLAKDLTSVIRLGMFYAKVKIVIEIFKTIILPLILIIVGYLILKKILFKN